MTRYREYKNQLFKLRDAQTDGNYLYHSVAQSEKFNIGNMATLREQTLGTTIKMYLDRDNLIERIYTLFARCEILIEFVSSQK